jgi:hypothetical protein
MKDLKANTKMAFKMGSDIHLRRTVSRMKQSIQRANVTAYILFNNGSTLILISEGSTHKALVMVYQLKTRDLV